MLSPEAVGFAASAITCYQVGDQVRLVLTAPSIIGISALTWTMALVQSVGLFVFSAARGFDSAATINGLVGVACVVILSVIVYRSNARRRRSVTTEVIFAAATLSVAAAFGSAVLGSLGAVAAALVWIPQAIRAARIRSDAGLSLGLVVAGILSSVLWLVYAILKNQWRLGVAPTAAIISMVITAYASRIYSRAGFSNSGARRERSADTE